MNRYWKPACASGPLFVPNFTSFPASVPCFSTADQFTSGAEKSANAKPWKLQSCCEPPRTRQTLRQYDLDSLYPHGLDDIARRLHELTAKDPLPGALFALAEINYLRAERRHKNDPAGACACYYLAAGYAYHHILGKRRGDV